MKITSITNDTVKETAKLLSRKYRDESGMFLLEGEKCLEEAILSGIEIVRIFSEEGIKDFCGIETIETTEAVLSKISSTTSAPKIVGVGKQRKPVWRKDFKKIVLLEGIKDAGNLGTILRTACAFNIDAIMLYGETIDLYNPKCVRSSVGNLWKVPVFKINNFEELKNLTENFDERLATLPKSNKTIWLNDYKPANKFLLLFGSEADGLSDELKQYATKNITIEMSSNVESLNSSMSAGIILYKLR